MLFSDFVNTKAGFLMVYLGVVLLIYFFGYLITIILKKVETKQIAALLQTRTQEEINEEDKNYFLTHINQSLIGLCTVTPGKIMLSQIDMRTGKLYPDEGNRPFNYSAAFWVAVGIFFLFGVFLAIYYEDYSSAFFSFVFAVISIIRAFKSRKYIYPPVIERPQVIRALSYQPKGLRRGRFAFWLNENNIIKIRIIMPSYVKSNYKELEFDYAEDLFVKAFWINPSTADKRVIGWKKDVVRGQGIYTYINGDVYVGEYENDNFCGHGRLTYANGNVYLGEWKDNKKNGHGVFSYVNGDVYEGEFKDGKKNGHGTMTYADGTEVVGEWKDGEVVSTD